jgi:hypothetical protein
MAKESYAESWFYLFLLLIGQTEHVDDLYDSNMKNQQMLHMLWMFFACLA